MIKYILKRLAIAALTLLVIVFILYLMLQLMPGTPFNDEKLRVFHAVLLSDSALLSSATTISSS